MAGFSHSSLESIGLAISTIDTELLSPLTPRTPRWVLPRSPTGRNSLSINTEQTYATFNSSLFLDTPTPRKIPSASPRPHSTLYLHHDDDRLSSSSTLAVSLPSQEKLPITPSFYPTSSSGELGTFSAINIILGKTIGVGIYSIPSSVFNSVGSVGASITLWILGSLISFCGLAVYMDLGTAMPRSGGERIYLERIFKKPYMLTTCMFMSYVVLLGFSTPNCIVLGEYVMYILGIEANRWNVRLVAVGVISVICFIHGRYQKTGLRIINILGVGKMVILVVVILSGIAGVYMGVGSSTSPLPVTPRRLRPDGYLPFDQERYFTTAQINFSNLFAGSSTQPHDYATALLKVLYCYRGYSTANQVLGQVRNPIQTLKRAAPIALFLVSAAYICANIAYFAVVSREDFRSSGALIAGHFFRNVFGQRVGENILPLLIIISAFGNIAATSFAQARVNMELGRDGILPFANFFKVQGARGRASTQEEEQNATPGLFIHWFISVLFIVLPPPGEIYNFLVDIGGYPVSVISVAISLGLLYLQMTPSEHWKGHHGCEAKKIYTIIFASSNILLLALPWIKPSEGLGGGERFQWYAYPSTSLGILGLGVVYWVWWAKIKPIVFSEEGMEALRVQQRRYDSPELMPMMGSESGEEEDFIDERLRMRLSAVSLRNLYR